MATTQKTGGNNSYENLRVANVFNFLQAGFYTIFAAQNGPVAQLNRAFDYGSKGFRFES